MSTNQKMLIISNVSNVNTEKARSDGKKSRQFVTVQFCEATQDAAGRYVPNYLRVGSRNIFQAHTPDGKDCRWKTTPEQLKEMLGNKSLIGGAIISKKVKQFPVIGSDGQQQKRLDGTLVYAEKYTAIVLNGETAEDIFRAAGHEITGDLTPEEVASATTSAFELKA